MKDKVYGKEVTVAIHPGYEEDNKPNNVKVIDDALTTEFKAMASDSGVKIEELTKLNQLISDISYRIETLQGS